MWLQSLFSLLVFRTLVLFWGLQDNLFLIISVLMFVLLNICKTYFHYFVIIVSSSYASEKIWLTLRKKLQTISLSVIIQAFVHYTLIWLQFLVFFCKPQNGTFNGMFKWLSVVSNFLLFDYIFCSFGITTENGDKLSDVFKKL